MVVFDITIGLVVGIGCNMFMASLQALLSTGDMVCELDDTAIYISIPKNSAPAGKFPTSVRIFRFNSSLYFINAERYKMQLYRHTFNPLTKQQGNTDIDTESPGDSDGVNGLVDVEMTGKNATVTLGKNRRPTSSDIQSIILDMSQVSYMDITGINLLKQLITDYRMVGVNIVLAGCTEFVLQKLKASQIIKEDGTTTIDIYPTLHDAAVSSRRVTVQDTIL